MVVISFSHPPSPNFLVFRCISPDQIVNGGEFLQPQENPTCAQVAAALPWRCPGAALNFLTDKSMQGLQVFFLYGTCLVRGLSPGAALDF